MKAFFSYISWLLFARPVKQQLRTRSLQSLRLYVKAVSGARKASMFAVLGVMGLASIAFGFFLLIGGLLWLANLNPAAYPWIMVGVGALLTLAGIAGYVFAFRQKLWIELSRINDFTEAAVKNFPVDERPENPALTAMWAMAADARLRETSANLNPAVESPYVAEPTRARPAPQFEPATTF